MRIVRCAFYSPQFCLTYGIVPRDKLVHYFIDCDDWNYFLLALDVEGNAEDFLLLHKLRPYLEWWDTEDDWNYDTEDWLFDYDLDVFMELLREAQAKIHKG